MDEIIVKIQEYLTFYGIKIIAALAVYIIGTIVAKAARSMIRKLMERASSEATLITFVTSLAYYAMLAFVIIAALAQLGIQTTSFIAVLGAAGLAVGLALQGSLSNFAAGVLLIIFRPFKANDFVEAAGTMGTVTEIGIFTTVLKSPDNKKIIVPNSKMTGDNIINYSSNDTRRVDMVAGVGYGDDLDKVKSVLEAILSEDERILKEPAPVVAVSELADSSVNFVVRPWVETAEYWNVYFDLQKKIKQRFDEEGISIPFPQRDVHMIKED